MLFRHIILLLVLLLSGCENPLTKALNAKYPPMSADQQRAVSVNGSAEALDHINSPSLAFSVRLSDIVQALGHDKLSSLGIEKLTLATDKQLLDVTATFKRTFVEADAGGNEDVRKFIAATKPEIAGTVEIFCGLSTASDDQEADAPDIHIKLLPGLSRFVVTDIKLAGKEDNGVTAMLLSTILDTYKDNVTGLLSRADFTHITVPNISNKGIDISKSLTFGDGHSSFAVDVKAKPITPGLRIGAIAWLLSDDRLTGVVQIDPVGHASLPDSAKSERTFAAIEARISGLLRSAFGLAKQPDATWVAIRKDILASTITTSVNQAQACAMITGSSHQDMSSKIPTPDGGAIDCSSDRDCESPRTCGFNLSHDTRDCSGCLLQAPRICTPRVCAFGRCVGGGCSGGQCIQHGNNPVCELAKAAQNQIYLDDANLRKANCDSLRATETAACQAGEVVKKGLCETGKTTLNAIHQTGNFANIDVNANIKTDQARVCLSNFNLAPALDHVRADIGVNGTAIVDLGVKFVPLDIVGHLACQFPWTENQTFRANLDNPAIGIQSAIAITTEGNEALFKFAVDAISVQARLSPSPTEFLLKSPNMTVSCQGLNLMKPLVVALYPFIPALRGELEQKIGKQDVVLKVPMPRTEVAGTPLQVTLGDTPVSVVLLGKVGGSETHSPPN